MLSEFQGAWLLTWGERPRKWEGEHALGLTVCTRAPDQAAERWKDKPNCESEIKYCVEKWRQKGEWRGGGKEKRKSNRREKKKENHQVIWWSSNVTVIILPSKCGPTSIWPQKMEAQIKERHSRNGSRLSAQQSTGDTVRRGRSWRNKRCQLSYPPFQDAPGFLGLLWLPVWLALTHPLKSPGYLL